MPKITVEYRHTKVRRSTGSTGAWEEFASHASHARDKKQDPENLDSPFRGHHNEFVMNHNESVMFETNLL